jgi:hypothetical protein
LEVLIKGFHRSFAADGITEEHGNKIDYPGIHLQRNATQVMKVN